MTVATTQRVGTVGAVRTRRKADLVAPGPMTDHRPPHARQLTSQPPELTVDRNRARVTRCQWSASSWKSTDPYPADGPYHLCQRWGPRSQVGLSDPDRGVDRWLSWLLARGSLL